MRTLLLVRDLKFVLLLLPFQYTHSLSELSVIYLISLCPLIPRASKLEKSVGWLCVDLFGGKVTADDLSPSDFLQVRHQIGRSDLLYLI